jgi:hypothetical protein
VLNAMKNHLNESGVQENACGALQNIAADGIEIHSLVHFIHDL